MINYYKIRVSFYRIDTDSKSFTQVNDAEDASSVGVIKNERAFTAMSKVISEDGEFLSISEETFNFAKQKVLQYLQGVE
jgi:hypothetical protein